MATLSRPIVKRVQRLPLTVLFAMIGAALMWIPAIHAFATDREELGRPFLYASLLLFLLCWLVAAARSGRVQKRPARSQLLALFGAYTFIPLVLAVPYVEALDVSLWEGWLEMVSAVTTTGAAFRPPGEVPGTLHLWRASVGWMGGLFLWVVAAAILAPLNLGGFEVAADGRRTGEGAVRFSQIARVAEPAERLTRFTAQMGPVYLALTLVLALILFLSGDRPMTAVIHAMSTVATSGISAVGGVGGTGSGRVGEAFILLFLIPALSRGLYADESRSSAVSRARGDPELRLAFGLVIGASVLLFVRHYFGAVEGREGDDLGAAGAALWGTLFTTLGFLSTAGWESVDWDGARAWSALRAPGVVLMGLALIGGGVATTAGGVKLFRVYALAQHGRRELGRLVHPSSVAGSGMTARRIRRQGAQVAWVFFMLFALSVAGLTVLFAAAGIPLQDGLVYTFAGVSNTGPITAIAGNVPLLPGELPVAAQAIFAAAMILGRMELLAIIALLNPDLWRN